MGRPIGIAKLVLDVPADRRDFRSLDKLSKRLAGQLNELFMVARFKTDFWQFQELLVDDHPQTEGLPAGGHRARLAVLEQPAHFILRG